MVKMADGFEMQFVGDHQSRHIRMRQQLFGVLQFYFIYVLRNRAICILFEQARQVRIAVRQLFFQRMHLFGRQFGVVQIFNIRGQFLGNRRGCLIFFQELQKQIHDLSFISNFPYSYGYLISW